MKKDNTPIELKVFSMLMLVGILAGLVDSVAYHFHVRSHGVGFFSPVPWDVLWSYVKTFPGNVLTALWILPWVCAFAWLHVGGRNHATRSRK